MPSASPPAPAMAFAVALVAVLAGCAAPPPAPGFRAVGEAPASFAGYDPAAATMERGAGAFRLTADPATDAASLEATFVHRGQAWRVVVDGAVQREAWQQGGVLADAHLQGPTGRGPPGLPAYHVLAAGWGDAAVTVDGQVLADPRTGGLRFEVFWRVADLAPRDPATLAVTRPDGTPYDATRPAEGQLYPDTPQALLDVQSPGGPLPPDHAETWREEVTSNGFVNIHRFFLNDTSAHARINVTLTTPSGGVPAADIDFEVFDEQGNRPAAWEYDPLKGAQGETRATLDLAPPVLGGNYNLRARGLAAGVTYVAELTVDYADTVFVHVAYPQVRLG